MTTPGIERTEPELAGSLDERAMLTGWLDYHRATLALKCQGLDDTALRARAVPPSSLSLLGLVRHLTEVEQHWFHNALAGEHAAPIYSSEPDPDGDFDRLESAPTAQVFARWRAECAHARELVAATSDLEVRGRGRDTSLRWILTHMIEEYARHNGHADLLRECIDGVTGE